MAIYKLAVGDRIEFEVKFGLKDGGKEKLFGMRMSAERQLRPEQEADLAEQTLTKDYLAGRKLTLDAWTSNSPLRDENGAPVPAGPEALEALYELVPGMVPLVLAGYLQANSAKGRSGN